MNRTAGADFLIDSHQGVLVWNGDSGREHPGLRPYAPGARCHEVVRGTDPTGRPLCGENCTPMRALRDEHTELFIATTKDWRQRKAGARPAASTGAHPRQRLAERTHGAQAAHPAG